MPPIVKQSLRSLTEDQILRAIASGQADNLILQELSALVMAYVTEASQLIAQGDGCSCLVQAGARLSDRKDRYGDGLSRLQRGKEESRVSMTSQSPSSFTKEELWVLDLFSAAKDRSVSRKVLLGVWESTFPNDGVIGLRTAIKSLQDKHILKVSSDGSLSLEKQAEKPF